MVQWRKVTWYSKALALALFVAFPFIGFYFGIQIGSLFEITRISPIAQNQSQGLVSGDEYYSNISEWQSGSYPQFGFSLKYPIDFDVREWTAKDSADAGVEWRYNTNGVPGTMLFTINIPKAFEPHTNFAEAQLAVGRSNDPRAVASCLTPDPSGGSGAVSKRIINGVAFFVSESSGAGAGNYYETTSHRAIQAGYCYAIEYMIHSTQVMNYPESYGLKPFDKARVADLFERIIGTFGFL